MDDLLDKKKPSKSDENSVPKKSQKQLESEELDFLLAQSLANSGPEAIGKRTRGGAKNPGDISPLKQKNTNSDPKIKPRNMKKSTAQVGKMFLSLQIARALYPVR